MSCIKMLGLAAVAAAALMAIAGAGTASATTLTSGAGVGVNVGDTIDFSVSSGNSTILVDTSGKELNKCTGSSTISGTVSQHGGTGVAVRSTVSTLDWTTCTFATKTLTSTGIQVNGTGAGNVSATGTFEWTINTVLFGTCIYGVTSGTSLGTLASGAFTANAVVEKFPGSNIACPATGKFAGIYVATTPAGLKVDP